MAPLTRKLIIAGVIVGAAVGYLAYAGMKQGWVYYVSVDQFAQDAAQQKHRVRLMGTVADEGIDIAATRTSVTFLIAGSQSKVPVQYRGNVPDLFKAGADVVVEGKMNGSGRFEADTLLTKCASKYDAKHPGSQSPQQQAQMTVKKPQMQSQTLEN